MSPSARDINAPPRPAPLKIHKNSHLIHKSPPPSSPSSTISTAAAASNHHHQRRHPVIIYTHSPKVIHTQASDFMALVQKLTGQSRSPDGNGRGSFAPRPPSMGVPRKDNNEARMAIVVSDDSSSSSENCGFAGDGHLSCSSLSSAVSSVGFDPPPPPNPFMAEIPLLTPGSSDFFYCPSTFFGCTDSSAFSSASVTNVGGAISPSVIEAMNAYHEY